MPKHIPSPDDQDRERVLSMIRSVHLHGECYALAIAIHQGTGLPLCGLMDGTIVHHVGVRLPNGKILDARGFVSDEEFGQEFPIPQPYTIQAVTVADLLAARKVSEFVIEQARHLAEVAWPELPWQANGYKARVEKFVIALEALSKEHGLWIAAQFPGARPVITRGEPGDCYSIQTVNIGQGFLIDRARED
jgi:hypothetical protein